MPPTRSVASFRLSTEKTTRMHSMGSFMEVLLLVVAASISGTACRQMPMLFSRDELVRIAGYGEEKLSSVLVVGTVLCDACSKPGSDIHASPISGAKIAVPCKTEGKTEVDWTYGTTDDYGEFMVDLPSHLHAIPRLEESCKVRVLQIPKSTFCRSMTGMKLKGLELSSVGNSIRVYNAGAVRLNNCAEELDRSSLMRKE